MKQIIAYFTWFCVLLSTFNLAPAHAELCLIENDDDEKRVRNAYIVAGLTVIGIAGGIAALSSASGHHKHHTSSSYSYSRRHDHYSYSGYSGHHHHNHRGHNHRHDRHHKHHKHNSHHYSIFSENNVSSWSDSGRSSYSAESFDQFAKKRIYSNDHAEAEETQISGTFISHSDLTDVTEGSFTAFVQLPDGTTRSLGSLLLSGRGTASLPYGPFDQKGTYTFGVSLDRGIDLQMQTKAGSVEIQVNGSVVQRHDFIFPPHATANYEPAPCCFENN